jgi:probable H4MPT-linked C1 transfer pathway protein
LDKLEFAVKTLLEKLPNLPKKHAITMTGELVDLFANRHDGVKQILQTMWQLLSDSEIHIFCGKLGLLPISEINQNHFDAIASANWLASASFAAKQFEDCLFVDIGSTTTDILFCEGGEVLAQGFSDYERLISQELIYTGIVRTAVMSVVQTVYDNEKQVGIMAEHFATMADVYRLTGELTEYHDQADTADGAEKTIEASARRLSRMLGDDFRIEELPRWQSVARDIRQQQKQRIQNGCSLHLKKKSTLIGAGIGRFLVQEIAERLGCDYVDFSSLLKTNYHNVTFNPADCAPAVAMAFLVEN